MPSDWKPEIPLREIDPRCLKYAETLRLALAATWPRLADRSVARAEVERLGLEDWRRHFDYSISARHWRRIVELVQSRGGGQSADIDPPAVYLPAKLRRAAPTVGRRSVAPETPANPEMRPLSAALHAVANLQEPTPAEKAWLWGQIFEHFEDGLAKGKPEREWKGRVIAWVWENIPAIAGSPESLRRLWGSKLQAWRASGRDPNALADGRCVSRGAPALSEADRQAIESAALFETGGRLAPALRLARQRGALSPEFTDRFTPSNSRPDYVPESVRREIAPALPALGEYLRGPRTGKLAGAYLERDWSLVASGDWYQADDCTLPVYYWIREGDWYRLTRGQCLFMIDLRSRKILDFVLIHEKSYDGIRIRRLGNKVCNRYGLPRRGLYFEGGIWEKSRIVTGGKEKALPSLAEIETGFRALGIEFRHARSPRAKPIERVLGLLQDRMEAVPGYAGRNEIVDRFEHIHRAKLDVEARRKLPWEAGFLSAEEWFSVLCRICEEYNATPMDGQATGGLSPDEAWERYQDHENPPARLPAEAMHLLATHRTLLTVGRNGVRVTVGKRSFVYRSADTGMRLGQRVIAWFDPDAPEFCTITDTESRNPVTVPLAPSVPAMDATPAQMAAAMANLQAHEGAIKERFSRLKASYIPPFRPNLVSPSTAALGREMKEQREAAAAEARRQSRVARTLRGRISQTLGGRGGGALAAEAAADPERAEALKKLADFAAS